MPLIDIAAALASLGQGESPLLLKGVETFRAAEGSVREVKPAAGMKPARGMKSARGGARGAGNRKFRRRARP
jgi:hypothetical protein